MIKQNDTSDATKFPIELLHANADERVEYYRNVIVLHPILLKTVNDTLDEIQAQINERIIFVCGPSGVGKKEFIKFLTQAIISWSSPNISSSCIPVVSVEAPASYKGSFDFPQLWKLMLTELNDPFLGYKRLSDLQYVLHSALKHREVKAVIINEAQLLMDSASGLKVNQAANLLKTLTNCGQTPIVLVGTYDLLSYLELDKKITDQINQRATTPHHFSRYSNEKQSDIEDFGAIAKLLLLKMPLEETSEQMVDKHWEYFYTHSLGCVGILKTWFTDALLHAINEKSHTLTMKHLESTKKTDSQLLSMYTAMTKGEIKFEQIFENKNLYTQIFGSSKTILEPEPEVDINNRNNKKSKPFEVSPKRRKVKPLK